MSIPVKINDAGLGLIMYFEKCKLKAFKPTKDPTEPWTIGWGHTGADVVESTVWSQGQADRALVDDLNKFCKAVTAMIMVDVTDNQYSALVSLCYNIGITALKNSTLMKKLNFCDYHGAAAQFDVWNKDGGKVCEGLVKRREKERLLFET